jgi:bacteriocin biosynthesis cyclodehydratase domain-containing protein
MKHPIILDRYIALRPNLKIEKGLDGSTVVLLDGCEIADITSGTRAEPILDSILIYLDGGKTAAEIIEHSGKNDIKPADVIDCLEFLLESGFLYQFDRVEDIHSTSHYANRTYQPQKILAHIAKSKVLMCGEPYFSGLVADSLINTGIINLVQASCPIVETDKTEAYLSWNKLAETADLIVLFNVNLDEVLFINAWCVERNKVLVVGSWNRSTIWFGPFLIPHVTACQSCLRERLQHWHQNNYLNSVQSGTLPMVATAANLLAGLCVEFLSGSTLNKALTYIHQIDLQNISFLVHPTIKNPRCRVCSRLLKYPEGAAINA